MNKIYLWGIIIVAVMLGFTYMTVLGSKGGLNGDIINILTVAAAAALVIITIFVVIKYVRQMQVDTATGELAEESWDGIGEYKNDVPFGWAIIFLGTMVWGMWYFVIGYPVNAFSQIGQYNEEVATLNKKFESKYASITGDRLVEMGESVFLSECVACHGISADGNDGMAANLNQRISAKSVKYVIEHGSKNNLLYAGSEMPNRSGLMNANKNYAPITDAEIDSVASYVANGMTGAGANVFAGVCSSCHGTDGKGIDGVAPNIVEFTPAFVVNVLNNGKKGAIGTMPKFDKLNKKQKEAVGAYVASLSK